MGGMPPWTITLLPHIYTQTQKSKVQWSVKVVSIIQCGWYHFLQSTVCIHTSSYIWTCTCMFSMGYITIIYKCVYFWDQPLIKSVFEKCMGYNTLYTVGTPKIPNSLGMALDLLFVRQDHVHTCTYHWKDQKEFDHITTSVHNWLTLLCCAYQLL